MLGSSPPNLVAIDLGGESCRVSLLQWKGGAPQIELVHRFPNAPVQQGGSLHWNLSYILSQLERGLHRCAQHSPAPIAAIGVDGWAVDYVRLGSDQLPLAAPFCYRDLRTQAAETAMRSRISNEELFRISGVQPLRINTLYQLAADRIAGVPAHARWVNLPEYVLAHLGGRRVAEYTSATHTGLVDSTTRQWSSSLFDLCGSDIGAAPELVPTGTEIGTVQGSLHQLPAFASTRLIAPACHDTASAVAGIPAQGDDWAYISSGTWSLVGALLDHPILSPQACTAGFTNLGAAGGRICFHKNVNGMWLLQQVFAQLCPTPGMWPMTELLATCERVPTPAHLLDLDDASLLLPGRATGHRLEQDTMATRINAQRAQHGLEPLPQDASAMPIFASLIFHSLAQHYVKVLGDFERLTGRRIQRIWVVGGGSLNPLLNRLTAGATGREVCRGVAESSTIGNLAVQLATLEGEPNASSRIAHWARILTAPGQA
ncbi:MAG: rhamnulokinase [Acidobacteriaceae bacterium]